MYNGEDLDPRLLKEPTSILSMFTSLRWRLDDALGDRTDGHQTLWSLAAKNFVGRQVLRRVWERFPFKCASLDPPITSDGLPLQKIPHPLVEQSLTEFPNNTNFYTPIFDKTSLEDAVTTYRWPLPDTDSQALTLILGNIFLLNQIPKIRRTRDSNQSSQWPYLEIIRDLL